MNCTHDTTQEVFRFQRNGFVYTLELCTFGCQQEIGYKLKDGIVLERYDNPIMVGYITDGELLEVHDAADDLMEIGFDDLSGELSCDPQDHVWVQNYGMWNPPISWDGIRRDQVEITEVRQNWHAS